MSVIKQLDEATINKIAAGEVIERPAGVVKELIENATDANASAITVEIKDGGISMIRITDNGSGIAEDDLDNAFLRHSTSKISSVEDLITVKSLGFRGEALSSIAAVSQVELITKTSDSLLGSRYIIEGGIKKSLESVGAPKGTTFIIRNLFYNTPVRKKFLKTPQTEGGYIKDIVEKMAIAHPDISFKLIMNGQLKLSTSGNSNLKDIIYSVYGRDITNNLIEIKQDADDDITPASNVCINGYIGKSIVSRGNRGLESFFVNGRYIKSSLISKAVEDAYAPFMMGGRYPFCALSISINPEMIDVNIHPTKMEIKFSDSEQVYSSIFNSIRNALTQKPAIVEISIDKKENVSKNSLADSTSFVSVKTQNTENNASVKPYAQQPHTPVVKEKPAEPYEYNRISQQMVAQETATYMADKIKEERARAFNKTVPLQMELFDKNNEDYKKKNYHIVGQLFSTYWIIEYEDKMYIIDQHAAHEKVLYEQLCNQLSNNEISSQNLNPPIIVTLTGEQESILTDNMDAFEGLGFKIEHFGGTEYNLYAIPANLPRISQGDFFLEILDMMSQNKNFANNQILMEKLASMSCKAAVKGGNKLSTRECISLIDQLMLLENPFNCPHGRPVIISMTKQELEKKFKRIV